MAYFMCLLLAVGECIFPAGAVAIWLLGRDLRDGGLIWNCLVGWRVNVLAFDYHLIWMGLCVVCD